MTNMDDSLAKKLPEDIQSSETIQSLLSDPLPTIVAIITGALASGRSDVILSGGRLVQAMSKGRAWKQAAEELDELRKKGKIRSDYADTKYGFSSFVDLMKTIDSDATDEDKLRAAKAMFVALNSPDTSEREEMLRYQMFRIVLNLSGPQIAMLFACRRVVATGQYGEYVSNAAKDWFNAIGGVIGHNVVSLMELDESALIKYGILTDRSGPERISVTQVRTARLTDLGVKIAELIEKYDSALPKP